MRHWTIAGLAVCGLLGLLAGCEHAEQPAIHELAPLPGATAAAPSRVNGGVGTPEATPPAQVSVGTPPLPTAPGAPGAPQSGDISLDFADTDVREVASQILGNILKVNYTIDPAVHGSVTLHTVTPLARTQLLATLQALLQQNGAALVQEAGLYHVETAAAAAGTLATADTSGTEVVKLRYASAEDLAKTLQPYVGQGGKIVADTGRNALLVSGAPQARDALVDMVHAFDTDVLAHQSYALLPVTAGDAKDVASALESALRSGHEASLAAMVHVTPMERINAVLVISSQARYIDEAQRVYDLIDRARAQTVRGWHVYYLQNSHADDIAYVMQQAFTPDNVTAQPTSAAQAAQRMSTGVGGLGGNFSAGGSGGLGASSLGTSGLGAAGMTGGLGVTAAPVAPVAGATPQGAAAPGQTVPAPAANNPLLGPLGAGAANSVNPDSMRIIPDEQNNALLLYGTRRETDTMQAMLRKIDILPLQVRIDAVIAEVQLNDNLQYGTQFFFKSGGLNGILNASVQTSVQTPAQAQLNLNFPGFFIGGHGAGGAPFAINALQAVTQVHVLSSPELMVLDNQPARLQVGDVVPYLSQTSQSTITSNAPVVNSINYQQTGVVMQVTPRVNSGGLVTLDIVQDVSDVSTTITTPGINSPTFLDRNISSRVVAQDGQTVGLAGLIRDNASVGNQGIPWLKDVPILGLLAGNQNNARQRTELLILITPHVIYDQRSARELTEDLREHLINAAAVPEELNALPPSGSGDPGARLRRQLKLQP